MTIQEALSIIRPEAHTMEAVKTAYRELAKRFHPDVNPNGLDFEQVTEGEED